MIASRRVQEIRSAYGVISMSTWPQTGTVRCRVVSGGVGDLAPDPRFDLPGLDPGPQAGQPVPQVQRGRDQCVCGVGGDPEHRAELGGGELGHLRGAGTAEPEQPFTTQQRRPAARLSR